MSSLPCISSRSSAQGAAYYFAVSTRHVLKSEPTAPMPPSFIAGTRTGRFIVFPTAIYLWTDAHAPPPPQASSLVRRERREGVAGDLFLFFFFSCASSSFARWGCPGFVFAVVRC